ncbi:MAG: c-type cytochrome [Alphaproteobacteria bacterium]|nr:c-type cytochrome [Alphaproteobacteria bacterium]
MRSQFLFLTGVLGVAFVVAACSQDDPGSPPEVSARSTPDASSPQTFNPDAVLIEQGRVIAERECAGCHALGSGAAGGGRPDAPSMAVLLGRYDEEALINHLVDGVKLGHEDMPLFDFNVLAADALVAYLKSIRQASAADSETPY